MPLSPPQREAAPQRDRHLFLQIAIFALAATLIGRVIPFGDYDPRFAVQYETWHMGMPFQARCMLVPLLHWAAHSRFMIRASHALQSSSRGPDQLMLQLIDVLCLFLAGALVVRLRNRFTPPRLFPWLAPMLLLWASACTFALRYESRFSMPYDLTSVVFFTIGLIACIEYRPLLLILVIAVGTYNRETTVFLLPIWLACNWSRSRLTVLATSILGAFLWIAIKLQIRHWLHNAPYGYIFPLNPRMLLPNHWAQDASIAGFLIWPIFVFRRLITDSTLRKVWLGYIPYLAANVLFGWWNETRIFGELIPIAAITAAIQFEQFIRNQAPASAILSAPAATAPDEREAYASLAGCPAVDTSLQT